MPETLQYAMPATRKPPVDYLRWAIRLALAPLVVGTLTFGLWVITGWSALMLVGIFTIIGGVACVLAGLICLLLGWRSQDRRSWHVSRRGVLAIALLLVNFPAAWGYVTGASILLNRYTIVIVNDTPLPLTNVVLDDGRKQHSLPDIPANGRTRYAFQISGDSSLALQATHGQQQIREYIDGYVTSNMSGPRQRTTLIVNADGTRTVQRRQ